jgi:hypothetical protein
LSCNYRAGNLDLKPKELEKKNYVIEFVDKTLPNKSELVSDMITANYIGNINMQQRLRQSELTKLKQLTDRRNEKGKTICFEPAVLKQIEEEKQKSNRNRETKKDPSIQTMQRRSKRNIKKTKVLRASGTKFESLRKYFPKVLQLVLNNYKTGAKIYAKTEIKMFTAITLYIQTLHAKPQMAPHIIQASAIFIDHVKQFLSTWNTVIAKAYKEFIVEHKDIMRKKSREPKYKMEYLTDSVILSVSKLIELSDASNDACSSFKIFLDNRHCDGALYGMLATMILDEIPEDNLEELLNDLLINESAFNMLEPTFHTFTFDQKYWKMMKCLAGQTLHDHEMKTICMQARKSFISEFENNVDLFLKSLPHQLKVEYKDKDCYSNYLLTIEVNEFSSKVCELIRTVLDLNEIQLNVMMSFTSEVKCSVVLKNIEIQNNMMVDESESSSERTETESDDDKELNDVASFIGRNNLVDMDTVRLKPQKGKTTICHKLGNEIMKRIDEKLSRSGCITMSFKSKLKFLNQKYQILNKEILMVSKYAAVWESYREKLVKKYGVVITTMIENGASINDIFEQHILMLDDDLLSLTYTRMGTKCYGYTDDTDDKQMEEKFTSIGAVKPFKSLSRSEKIIVMTHGMDKGLTYMEVKQKIISEGYCLDTLIDPVSLSIAYCIGQIEDKDILIDSLATVLRQESDESVVLDMIKKLFSKAHAC